MTLRAWANTMGGIFLISLYASIFKLVAPQGLWFYIMIGIWVVVLSYVGLIIYRSSDKKQIELKLKKHKEQPGDIFSVKNYQLAKETSSKALHRVSSIVRETYGQEEIEGMLNFLQEWKEKTGFEWDNDTVYDELNVEGTLENSNGYIITHDKYTKTFKIKGILEIKKPKTVTGKNARNSEEENNNWKYTISGLTFHLKNVLPEDIGKNAIWSISVDTTEGESDTGIITDKKYLD